MRVIAANDLVTGTSRKVEAPPQLKKAGSGASRNAVRLYQSDATKTIDRENRSNTTTRSPKRHGSYDGAIGGRRYS